MRLFIGVDLPDSIKDAVAKVQKQLTELDLYTGRLVPRENLHVTMLFLGNIPQEKLSQLSRTLSTISFNSFTLTLGSVEVPNWSKPHVLWIHTHCDELVQLSDLLSTTLSLKQERPITGHCTIVRLKTIKNKRALQDALTHITLEPLSWQVTRFVLYESSTLAQGASYTSLNIFPLGKRA